MILKRIHRLVHLDKLCVYCSVNKHYVKEIPNRKKSRKMVTAITAFRFNGETREKRVLFKEQRQKREQNRRVTIN